MKPSPALLFAAAMALAAVDAGAQPRVIPNQIGTMLRYQGDTIWNERDTTITRTVYKGDTIVTDRFMNGRHLSGMVQVVDSFTVRLIRTVDSTGVVKVVDVPGPVSIARVSRQMAMSAIMNASRPPLPTMRPSPTEVPWSPASPVTYCSSRGPTLIQHRDTVRYVRRLANSRADTTIFVFTGDTTVVRLGAAPRTFGYTMTNTLVGEMRMALTEGYLATRGAPVSLPGASPYTVCAAPQPPTAPAPAVRAAPSGASLPMNTVSTRTGLTYHYRGDTIWQARDTTVWRTVYGPDTIRTTYFVNGDFKSVLAYVVVGDSARALRPADAQPGWMEYLMPLRSLGPRNLLESTLRTPLRGTPGTTVPQSPAQLQTYCTLDGVRIEQVADTARYIRRVAAGRADTSTFVFVGDTTVKRLSPPREFGKVMVTTIMGDMTNALVQQSLNARNAAAVAASGLPGSRVQPGCGP